MTVDLRKDAADVRTMLERRTAQFLSKSPGETVSGIELGYSYHQGWVVAFFDTRPQHEIDGEWTAFDERNLLYRPHWQAAADVMRRGVTFILPDGRRFDAPPDIPESDFAGVYGQMLADVLVAADAQGVFAALPKRQPCQFDVEEFDGAWAWMK
ncbi:MAG TPA: hypothetical protein VGR35_07055 [Tepidisphaeraceae bacterium]|nr:hypothetical protein [Tepidisphaeraceae bacterium]